jgi:hypothetical protein
MLASAGLGWPHYFVDLSSVGGSADPASNLVVIAACTRLAPSSPTQPTPAGTATPPATSTGLTPTTASPGTSASASSTPDPSISPSAAVSVGQGCLQPELVALNL